MVLFKYDVDHSVSIIVHKIVSNFLVKMYGNEAGANKYGYILILYTIAKYHRDQWAGVRVTLCLPQPKLGAKNPHSHYYCHYHRQHKIDLCRAHFNCYKKKTSFRKLVNE